MSGTKADGAPGELVLEFDLDAPPEAVWRAIDTPLLRAEWLSGPSLTDGEVLPSGSGRAVRFRMRDDEPPFVETSVTFTILPRREGGTRLRISHGLPDAAALRTPPAANGDAPLAMRAA